jgi:hypothetical protein
MLSAISRRAGPAITRALRRTDEAKKMDAERNSRRIGTAERQQAYAELDAHHAAGRVELTEYDDRYGKIARATTQGELDAILRDLRQPEHPKRNGWRTATLVLSVACVAMAATIAILVGRQSAPAASAVAAASGTPSAVTPAPAAAETARPASSAVASSTSSAVPVTISASAAPSTPAAPTAGAVAGSGNGVSPAVYTSGSLDVKITSGYGVDMHQPAQWFTIGGNSDINFSAEVLAPGDGTSLSFFGAQQPSYQDCRARQDYSGAEPWTKVPSGSYVCVKLADNRVGQARVDYHTDQSTGALVDVDVSGLIYEPTK